MGFLVTVVSLHSPIKQVRVMGLASKYSPQPKKPSAVPTCKTGPTSIWCWPWMNPHSFYSPRHLLVRATDQEKVPNEIKRLPHISIKIEHYNCTNNISKQATMIKFPSSVHSVLSNCYSGSWLSEMLSRRQLQERKLAAKERQTTR